jgi:hypothetical protein
MDKSPLSANSHVKFEGAHKLPKSPRVFRSPRADPCIQEIYSLARRQSAHRARQRRRLSSANLLVQNVAKHKAMAGLEIGGSTLLTVWGRTANFIRARESIVRNARYRRQRPWVSAQNLRFSERRFRRLNELPALELPSHFGIFPSDSVSLI